MPVTLHCRPWATGYRLPDGRSYWCLTLWWEDEPRTRVLSTVTLRAYLRRSGLHEALGELEALLARAAGPAAGGEGPA